MSKRAPSITAEERERNRRMAEERNRAICAAEAEKINFEARAWLLVHGALVEGEGEAARQRRLAGYRQSLVQASAPAYRPTVRQLQAALVPGIEEIEF